MLRTRVLLIMLIGSGICVHGAINRGNVDTSASSRSARFTMSIDTALSYLGMRVSDLSMPPDLLDRDRHRTYLHDALFTRPLAVQQWLDTIVSHLRSRHEKSQMALWDTTMPAVGLGRFKRAFHAHVLSADELQQRAIPLDTLALTASARILVIRFVGAFLQAYDAVSSARMSQRGLDGLQRMLDSLWTMSTEDEKLTLWQVTENETAGRESLAAASALVDTSVISLICSSGTSLHLDLLHLITETLRAEDVLRKEVISITLETPFGRIAIGGPGDDLYQGDYAMILDVAGNDSYHLTNDDPRSHSSCIIDISGNDVYRGSDHVIGAGHFGFGVLIDQSGDDDYSAIDFSIASGMYGVGIVHDAAGNDIYRSRTNGQGAGIYGIGILRDDAGHDLYVCAAQSQAFGGTNGAGILSDLQGNDRYVAVSPFADVLRYDDHQISFAQGAALGSRPAASGGLGLLMDASGNDLYSADIYGQGTGYWYGVGALIDLGGDDRYDAYQYAQGSGVHFALGILNDCAGNDVYVSHGVSQGCGHDIATGILRDDSGDDSYVCESLSLGAGNANAISILFDGRGNDSYSAANATNTLGYSDFRRGYGMIGLFIDRGGVDRYGEIIRNDTATSMSTYGAFLDLRDTAVIPPALVPQPSTGYRLTGTIDSLFIQASASHLRFQNAVPAARAELGRRGASALPYLTQRLGTQMPRERITIETVLPTIYKSNPDETRSILIHALTSNDAATVSLACTILGKVKCRESLPALQLLLKDASWKRRRLAANTIGEIDDTTMTGALLEACQDAHPYVQQRSVYHIGRWHGAAVQVLQSFLCDTQQIVRMAAIEGVLRGRRQPVSIITTFLDDPRTGPVHRSAVRLLGACDTSKKDVKTFSQWWKRLPQERRNDVARIVSTLPRPFVELILASNTKKKRTVKRS